MNVGQLKKHLRGIPNDYEVEFSKFFLIRGDKPQDYYTVIMDQPVIGIADSKEGKHVRFIMWTKDLKGKNRKNLSKSLGRIRKVPQP
jgi:hypothetical protein